ncbi:MULTISPECIES: hypothetical protein [Methylococcus]|jgi:hypothetical protein|uniref:Zinc ribbon domain-containing protein n=1 Tax=Methylococcus capsulatus TaxID=414 RepID=A0AA35Y1R0_METCP|nr:hypothetical protein [Methylococcus capsulatus]QXP87928.1 hypothetical protein KW112_01895 [Methylococcus capsulatus]QXP90718.1 hypothetical protein KW114_00670 [Methylococcus capsulatus]QXP92331.1 hypothetical protein KW113_07885 [Methylococcus capsulatus]UQN12951.1 hypothetical protein M3M30_03605 [Methylococcus capsulatus]CAI8890894.1 Zinc ribbon domain-containing protein [Methylococcus capsulatus]
MELGNCVHCGTKISAPASICPGCGKSAESSAGENEPPIRKLGGKFQAIGILALAAGIVATLGGAWWGPALAMPGVVLFMLGKM